jgi:transposase
MVLKRPIKRTDEATPLLAHLQDQQRAFATAIDLAPDFAALGRARQPDRFDSWLARATARAVAPWRRFATGLGADDEAVQASLMRPWSNGPVAGQSNRLNMLQRSMFGRATIDLLRQRFLRTA